MTLQNLIDTMSDGARLYVQLSQLYPGRGEIEGHDCRISNHALDCQDEIDMNDYLDCQVVHIGSESDGTPFTWCTVRAHQA